jgi:hypothetical protein
VSSWRGTGKTIPVYALLSRFALQATLFLDNAASVSVHFPHAQKSSLFAVRIERREGSATFLSIDDRGYQLCLEKLV